MIEKSTMFSLIHQSDDKWRLIRFALMDESVRGHDYILKPIKTTVVHQNFEWIP